MNKQIKKLDFNINEGFDAKILNGLPIKVVIENIYLEDKYADLKLYDRKGYRAKWAEKRLDKYDWDLLISQALDIFIEDNNNKEVDHLVYKKYGI